ncbi:MAG: CopG family antitoxin [Paracoccaceae bacterium]
MSADKAIPEMKSYEQIADFWDHHSLADYWSQTEPAEFDIAPGARRRYLIAIDPDILSRVQRLAHQRGLHTESLVNLFLEQCLHQLETTSQ